MNKLDLLPTLIYKYIKNPPEGMTPKLVKNMSLTSFSNHLVRAFYLGLLL